MGARGVGGSRRVWGLGVRVLGRVRLVCFGFSQGFRRFGVSQVAIRGSFRADPLSVGRLMSCRSFHRRGHGHLGSVDGQCHACFSTRLTGPNLLNMSPL